MLRNSLGKNFVKEFLKEKIVKELLGEKIVKENHLLREDLFKTRMGSQGF